MSLCYRAGPRALSLIRQRGLRPQDVRAVLFPATGPKWLVAAGFDRALIEGGFLARKNGRRTQLIGASAGAWRALALCARDPRATHAALAQMYCAQHFTRDDSPAAISRAYARLLEEVFKDEDIAHALDHPALEVAVVAARAARGTGDRRRARQAAALALAAGCNFVSARSQALFFTRVLFCSRPAAARSAPVLGGWRAERVALDSSNARRAALASGTVPLYMQPVTGIEGAAAGSYVDGGLCDYHVNQRVDTGGEGVALMFLHQREIVPGWFDKFVPWRRGRATDLPDLVLIHPDDDFVAALPGGHVPTREDFEDFVGDPATRMKRWNAALTASERLCDRLLEDASTGRIAQRVIGL